MASAVAGGLFNAFAFAGAGYLFKYFDKNGVMVRYLCVKYIFQLGIFSTFRLRVQIILTLP
jgi:hypothetical protein